VNRNRIIALLIFVGLVAAAVAGYALIPRQYRLGQRLNQTLIFWNDNEAFFFLNTSTIGKSSNFLSDKLARTRYGYLLFLLEGRSQFYQYGVSAYRLLSSGELQSLPLPEQATTAGSWALDDGKLKLTTVETEYVHMNGFRWDGEKFISIPPQPKPLAAGNTNLTADDLDDEEDREDEFLSASARKSFKDAGWHYKDLSGFMQYPQSTLAINLGQASFNLSITNVPFNVKGTPRFDPLAFGTRSMRISKSDEPHKEQALWSQTGWQTISRGEFETRAQHSAQGTRLPVSLWVWLAVFVLAMLWRFGAWGHLLLSFLGMKGRVLKNMPTSYSFPPASPTQFPALDTTALGRYTQEFESMGFVRLLDFSLVSNAPQPIPSFCRLYVHSRYHCFGEISQVFPRGQAPRPLACSIQSVLQDGWTLTFSDRKPMAAGSMIRRRKALSVSMPGTAPSALLQAFVQMRDQVCQDLGISVIKEDTLEAYIAKVQRTTADMRDAVQEKNFATAVSHVYYRKLSLLKTREEYTWLGDYPKEAERRKQGLPPVEARAL
jgi:hypothetical protein